jgi:hypothetical protein
MKKLFTLACTLLLMAGVSIAQIRPDSLSKTSQNYKKSKTASPASKVALNPQPLPPGERKAGGDPASKVSLNPQPLPPKVGSTATQKVSTSNKAGKKIMTPGAGARQ